MDNGALLRVNRNTYNADPGNTINWTTMVFGHYSLVSPGRAHPRTISHSGVEVYKGKSLWVSVAWKVPSMWLDSQSPIAPQPLLLQARKQPGLGDQQPLLFWEPRSGLAKRLELFPQARCVPRGARPSQGPHSLGRPDPQLQEARRVEM